ncbi:hypothetical protein [Pseudooceanicola aestuarii]|nr:hypothetical protein [Pseudooceanicola aestuarii]
MSSSLTLSSVLPLLLLATLLLVPAAGFSLSRRRAPLLARAGSGSRQKD